MEGENIRQQRGQDCTACHILQRRNNAHNNYQTNCSNCTALSIIVELKEFRNRRNLHRTQLACCQKAHNHSAHSPRAIIPARCHTNAERTLRHADRRSSADCQARHIDGDQNRTKLTTCKQKGCRAFICFVLCPQADAKQQSYVDHDNNQLNRHTKNTTFLPCCQSIMLL